MLLVELVTILILLRFLPTIQELIHCLKPIGFCISVVGFDADYGVSLLFP